MEFLNQGLTRGQNVFLTRENPNLRTVSVGVEAPARAVALGALVSMAAVLCDSKGVAKSDLDMVFFNQVVSADGSTGWRASKDASVREVVEVDLERVPDDVSKIVFVLFTDSGSASTRPLSRLTSCKVHVGDQISGQRIISTENFVPGMGDESALLLGEVYRHQGEWKFRSVGQGYQGGMLEAMSALGVAL